MVWQSKLVYFTDVNPPLDLASSLFWIVLEAPGDQTPGMLFVVGGAQSGLDFEKEHHRRLLVSTVGKASRIATNTESSLHRSTDDGVDCVPLSCRSTDLFSVGVGMWGVAR